MITIQEIIKDQWLKMNWFGRLIWLPILTVFMVAVAFFTILVVLFVLVAQKAVSACGLLFYTPTERKNAHP